MASVSKLALLLLCTYHTLVAHAGDDLRSFKVLPVGSPESAAVNCTAPRVTPSSGGVTVPLHHRHGPCSPLPSTKAPTWEEMLRHDQLRAAYIGRKFSDIKGGASDIEQSDAATVQTTPDTSLAYVITVRIGSPAVTQTMIIDTGSDVSWVQCKPCSMCHSQANPLFDPSSSSTYSPFSCSSAACAQLRQDGYGSGCSGSKCQYSLGYGDNSATTGTYSSDTLALGSNSVHNFQFGCSQSTSGNFLREQTAGLMGLGGGAESLASQTAGTFGKAFSYCLPTPSTAGSSGFLTLGAATSGFATTPMFKKNGVSTFYFARLEAIRVGGKQLNIPSSVFSTGSVMDSGTSITQLPPSAYSALSSAFKAGMKQYRPAPSGTGTCFNFSGQTTIRIPTVALVFSGGLVLDLPGEAIIQSSCLAFTAWRDDMPISIIGNVQQRTFEVLYDVGGGAFGFKTGAC